jgi:putative acetyltransferase
MIRYARASDHAAIALVVEAAFGRADEARLVAELRAAGDAMFELVAEAEGAVVGHILFSRLYADRAELIAALAPLAVRPDLQRTGVGAALVRRGLESAREFGAHGVLVLGDPAYYGRFGFSAEAAARVAAPFRGLPAFQALALEDDVFAAPMTVAYPTAFAVR